MTRSELLAWSADAQSLGCWQRSVLGNDGYYEAGEGPAEEFECPLCHGEGKVDGNRYDAREVIPATLVGYGIGDGLRIAERWAEHSVQAVADFLDLATGGGLCLGACTGACGYRDCGSIKDYINDWIEEE